MTFLRVLLARLQGVLGAGRLDARLDEELQTHLALSAAEHEARGLSPEDARQAALRALGGVTQTRERWRDVRSFPVLAALGQDLRYALRTYRRSPAFTVVAVLTLTLAIGANTTLFSLLNALSLRDLPVRDPGTLVQLSTTTFGSTYESGLTFPMFQRLANRTDVFSSVIGWSGPTVLTVTTSREQTHGAVWVVSGNFFSELGVQPAAGRLLVPEDIDARTLQFSAVAVLGHTFWQRHYGGDTKAIGQRLRVEGEDFTIVGITPPTFTALGVTIEPDVLVPLTAYPALTGAPLETLRTGTGWWVRTTGRRQPGVSLAQVRAALQAGWPALKAETVPTGFLGARRQRFLDTLLSVNSARAGVETGLRNRFVRPLVIVLAIAALLLLVACVNLAGLLLARALAREHEIRLRLALGAGRWRITRQVLVEGLLLTVVGAACGVLFAYASSAAIVEVIFRDYQVAAALDVTPDGRVLLFTAALALITGGLVSLVPAFRATRPAAVSAPGAGSRSVTRSGRTGTRLVGVQVALSVVLLTNAGLLVRTLVQIRAQPVGMDTGDVLVAFPVPLPGAYATVNNDTYYPALLQQLQRVPGVTDAAAALSKPAGGTDLGGGEAVARSDGPGEVDVVQSRLMSVSPGFFDTLHIGLMGGRDLAWTDHSRARRVAVVSATLGRRLFPGTTAVGRRVRVGVLPHHQDLEIVGVVADARVYSLKDDNLAVLYTPALQEPDASWKCVVIRARGVSLADIGRAVSGLGREHVLSLQSLDTITDATLLEERLTASIAAFFGALALVLAGIGLYGLLTHRVSQRRREFGIRTALGAAPGRIVRQIVADGLMVSLAGSTTGFMAAWASTRLVQSRLFGVTPHDPLALLAAPALLLGIAVLASVAPAIRAARVDPVIALRGE